MLLGAVTQRRMVLRETREGRDLAVQRVAGPEVALGVVGVHRRVGRTDVVVLAVAVVVLRVLALEQVLARRLVVARARVALLVPEVDDRVAAGEVHEAVRELVALQELVLGGAGRVVVAQEHPDVAGVVVAQERRQLVGVGVGVGVVVVVDEEVPSARRRARLGDPRARRLLEREVEHRLDVVVRRVVRRQRPRAVGDLAEHEELRLADVLRVLQRPPARTSARTRR